MTLQILPESPSALYDSNSDNSNSSPQHSSDIHAKDVLLGRGGQTNKHSGNKNYRAIVASHQQEYLNARKKDKVVIARRIVKIVQDQGGRFLKQDAAGQWVAVTDKRAQEKTSQALREGLDVRNQTSRVSPPRRSNTSAADSDRPRKRTKTTTSTPTSPSVVSVDATAAVIPTNAAYLMPPPAAVDTMYGVPAMMPPPRPASFLNYQRQLSGSDVTDACAV